MEHSNELLEYIEKTNRLKITRDIEHKDFIELLELEPIMVKNMKEELEKNGEKASVDDDYEFIPIQVVKSCLRALIPTISFEIREFKTEHHSFVISARLKFVKNNIERIIDGIGAYYLGGKYVGKSGYNSYQPDHNAYEIGTGIAYSRAIKNAAKNLGNLFGENLNHDKPMAKKTEKESLTDFERLNELFIEKLPMLNNEAGNRIREIIKDKEVNSYKKAIRDLESLE